MAKITTYTVDPAKRRILTVKNMEELGITDEFLQDLLNKKLPGLKRVKVDKGGYTVRDSNFNEIPLWPVGISINEKKVGNFPDPNAAKLGWITFFEIGSPLFEERSNIIQPTADVISTRTYDNRSTDTQQFSDTIEFTIENTINWTLSATGTVTFEGEIEGELQGEISKTLETVLEESLANSLEKENSQKATKTQILHNHKDDIGTETQVSVEEEEEVEKTTEFTSTNSNSQSFTGTGTAIGRGELEAELELSLTGSISGTLTTSWNSTSNVSGKIAPNTRIETLATQRRQIKQFTYEVPITFSGFIALNYDELVNHISDTDSTLPSSPPPAKIIPVNISHLNLTTRKDLYRAKGIAETVSVLDVNHTIFESKTLERVSEEKFGTQRPHNFNVEDKINLL
ncbi:hypothetical protein [Chryseobacterium gossypii]|uniref:hypothetical protein n=1 Tax=Chryseobacterium gossypii TaxID=3231602 RepID=UPI003525BC8B